MNNIFGCSKISPPFNSLLTDHIVFCGRGMILEASGIGDAGAVEGPGLHSGGLGGGRLEEGLFASQRADELLINHRHF